MSTENKLILRHLLCKCMLTVLLYLTGFLGIVEVLFILVGRLGLAVLLGLGLIVIGIFLILLCLYITEIERKLTK